MNITDLTVTQSSAINIYDAANVEEIIPPGWYIDPHVQVTAASMYISKLSEDSILAQLRPLERWRYVAKYNRGEFIIWLLALLGVMYMLINGAVHLGLSIFPSARAQNGITTVAGSSHDAFDWYGGALMGICLLCSLGIIMCAQKESKISFGKETTRTIIGFVAGFLTCGKQR